MKNILVSDVMTREPVIISPDASLLECAKKMVRKKVGSLLIAENKKLIGFIDQKDILWALVKKSKADLSKIKAIDISPKKIITIKSDASVQETINRMKKLKFEKLPVVDNGKLEGIITVRDILNFHPEIYPELEEFTKIREEAEKLKRIEKANTTLVMPEGICEECGERDSLYRINGMLVCESCKDSI
jgi:CBS domain-containing protein